MTKLKRYIGTGLQAIGSFLHKQVLNNTDI
jgi:hypothetical protein